MSKPTYKIIRTIHMIEGEGKSTAQVTEHEIVEAGLPWAEAKKRTRGNSGLKAIQEHAAAPVTVEAE